MAGGAGINGRNAGRESTHLAMVVALLLLAACTSPSLTAGITLGPNGIGVTPVVSTNVGGLGVGITPGTIR